MAINFPDAPALNDEFTDGNGVVWVWDGTAWGAQASPSGGGDIPTVAASQAEMEAGTETALRSMSPIRVKQAIDALAPSVAATERGVYLLEDFAGADDDAKLAAAIAQVQADTFKRPIALWQNRVYTFTDPVDLFNGFALIGPPRHGGQPVTTPRYPLEVIINVGSSQPFLRMPASGNVYNVHVSNLTFEAGSSGQVFLGYDPGGGAAGVLWTSVIRDVGFSLFNSVLGSNANKLLMTANTLSGFWNINNARDVSIHIGGSDNNLWVDGCLLDSPTSLTSGGAVEYHMWLDYLEKSNIGPMYITCEESPAGIRIDGSSSSGSAVTFHGGIRVEGRNAGQSSLGAVVHQNGGQVSWRDAWFAYGGSNFATAVGYTGRAGEAGIYYISGGTAIFDGCTYARAGTDGVADTVPFIYATGSGTHVRVRNQQIATDGGTFTTTGKAHVRAVSGAVLYHDGTITDVDAAYRKPGWGMINHGANASTARGTEFENYIWYGSVQPTNMTGQDIVIRTDEAV